MTDSINENDVLFGRGGATNNHVGNKTFRVMVTDHQAEYLGARKKDKALISKRIVRLIREKGGRFLRRGNEGLWIEVGDKKAAEKTSQALREGLDVRSFVVGTGKSPRRNSESSASTHETAARKRRRISPDVKDVYHHSPAGAGSLVGELLSMPDLQEEIPRMMPSFVFQDLPPVAAADCENVAEI